MSGLIGPAGLPARQVLQATGHAGELKTGQLDLTASATLGRCTREIAARLDIREVMVEFHLSYAWHNLRVPTRKAAVACFLGG